MDRWLIDLSGIVLVMTESKSIQQNSQGVLRITDPAEVQAACDALLTVNGKKLLVVRGGDAGDTAGRVFIMAANHSSTESLWLLT
jgi:hypothetical protein